MQVNWLKLLRATPLPKDMQLQEDTGLSRTVHGTGQTPGSKSPKSEQAQGVGGADAQLEQLAGLDVNEGSRGGLVSSQRRRTYRSQLASAA